NDVTGGVLSPGGFEIRAKNTTVIGCKVSNNLGSGIHVCNVATGSNIIGNEINNIYFDVGSSANGIVVDSPVKECNISNNSIRNCDGNGIRLRQDNDNCVISNNTIFNCGQNAIVIKLNPVGVTVQGNVCKNNNRGLEMEDTSDNCRIMNNDFAVNTNTSALTGTSNTYLNNTGIDDNNLKNTAISQTLQLTGDISPTQITSDQNNYGPTNLATSSVLRLDADSSFRTITGLAGGADGRIITLRNISANSILLANQNTGSTAANRFDFGGVDVPLFPSRQIMLSYDSTSSRWYLVSNGSNFIIPMTRYGLYATYDTQTTGNQGFWGTTAASGGSVSTSTVASVAGHPANFQWTLGTSTTGSGDWRTQSGSPILLGNSWYWRHDMIIRIDKLSDVTDTYKLKVGFLDGTTTEPTDGCYFRYTHSVNSGKWELVARQNNTETVTNATNTAVAAATWYHLTVIVNPAGTVAEFFQDGVSLGTVTSNIPTGAGRGTGCGMSFLKSAGTTDSAVITVDAQEVLGYANVAR